MYGFRYFGALEKVLLAAVIVTVLALVTEQMRFKVSLAVEPGGDYPLRLEGDGTNGGDSRAEWVDKDRLAWRCTLTETYEYRYCFAQIALGGINLVNFDIMRIDLDYQGPPDSIRMHLLNRGSSDMKSGAPPGEYRFKLNSLEWHGNLIPREQWYLGIIVAWVTMIIGHLIYRAWYFKTIAVRRYEQAKSLLARCNRLNVKRRHLEKMAKTDPLTGISNRADISDFLAGAVLDRRKSDNALSVIVIDIDYFKQINDTYGHDMGDKVLIAVANKLADTVRQSDGVGRWGGEEFLLVCPDTSLDDVEKLARKLCR